MFTLSLFIARDALGYFFQHAICVQTKSYRRLARSHFQVPVDFFKPRKGRKLRRLLPAFAASVRQAFGLLLVGKVSTWRSGDKKS
jgi:hypothetical protein